MRKFIIFLALAVLLIAVTSAEIIINSQPNQIYSLGEIINIPTTIKSLNTISSVFQMDLICSGNQINFYKNGVGLSPGQEKKMDPSLILTKSMINELKGTCIIKAILGSEYVLTPEFKISDLIILDARVKTPKINPNENLIFSGTAITESNREANGFLQINIYQESYSSEKKPVATKLETINNGFFTTNLTIPEKSAAGNYVILFSAYEKDPYGEITNTGTQRSSFIVNQIPINLEILIENPEVEPGTPLKAKIILHDQTGINIAAQTKITIKNSENKLKEKIEIATEESFEFPTSYKEEPEEYTITAESEGIQNQANFNIKEKSEIQAQIIDRTLIITNTGNVPYCDKNVLVKIGNQSLNLDPCLKVDEEEKYTLTAPDGNYDVEIITEEGSYKKSAALTGNVIDITGASSGVANLTRRPFVWLFVIAILGFISFNIYKKGFKRSIIGSIYKKRTPKVSTTTAGFSEKPKTPSPGKIFNVNNAELCLSIKGDKQNVSIIGLKIKNYAEVKSNLIGIKEGIDKISQLVKDYKVAIYENQENIFFIFSPTLTRTFKNDMPALELGRKIKEILIHQNKLFKQKIEFGLSLTYGAIIAKQGIGKLEFMSFGDLMTQTKKIAMIANNNFLLEEKAKERFGTDIKTEKFTIYGMPVYEIKEIKDKNQNDKFIRNFLQRIDKK